MYVDQINDPIHRAGTPYMKKESLFANIPKEQPTQAPEYTHRFVEHHFSQQPIRMHSKRKTSHFYLIA
uniref:Transposase n=1 Tax=Panagrellus redivivus TaxID=6233 RepID=A0A7E4USD8_PANRE